MDHARVANVNVVEDISITLRQLDLEISIQDFLLLFSLKTIKLEAYFPENRDTVL